MCRPPLGRGRGPGARTRVLRLTAVEGIKVGHHTLSERPTGCTAILVDGDAVGGVSQRGGAPGTRETDLLNPMNMVDKVNAVVLAGAARSVWTPRPARCAGSRAQHRLAGRAVARADRTAAILFDLGVGGQPRSVHRRLRLQGRRSGHDRTDR